MTAIAGIFDATPDVYHADAMTDQPTLSSSIAHLLCTSSPAHARAAHPRLNPAFKRDHEDKFDIGTSAHRLLLEGDDSVAVVNAPDWRTKAAQEEREAARGVGQTALLLRQWDEVRAMVAATRAQLDAIDCQPPLFTDGTPEQTLLWEDDGGVVCRARLDWLRLDLGAIDDYKTTSRSANPETWTRTTLYSIGADIQAAFYLRGLHKATGGGGDDVFRFVVQETFPPFALSVISLGPSVLALARKKVEYAVAVWRRCLERGEWPAYAPRVAYAELPPWEENRWLERELREQAA